MRMSLSPLGGRKGEGWGPPSGRGGAPSRRVQIHGAQSEGWAFTRNLVFLVFANDGISARKLRDKGEFLLLFGSSPSKLVSLPPCL